MSDAHQRHRLWRLAPKFGGVRHLDCSLEFSRARRRRPLDEMLVLFKVILVCSPLSVGMGISTFYKRKTRHKRREEENHHCVWMLAIIHVTSMTEDMPMLGGLPFGR